MPYPGEYITFPVHGSSLQASNVTFTNSETITDTITVQVVSGRQYNVRHCGQWTSSVSSDKITARIREDNVGGNQIQGGVFQVVTANYGVWAPLEVVWTAGITISKTFVVTGIRTSGSGTCQRTAASGTQSAFLVEQWV